MIIYCIRQKIVWCAVSWNRGVERFSKKQLLRVVSNFCDSYSSLLCWKGINGIAGCSKTGRPPILPKQQLSCRTSFVMALSDVGFGYDDSQTLCQLTSFCGDFLKKEFTAITQDAWRTSTWHWTGLCRHWRNLREIARKLCRARMLVFKKVGNIFSICCNCTFLAYKLFIAFAISLKNRNKKLMVYSWFDVFAFYTGHRRHICRIWISLYHQIRT